MNERREITLNINGVDYIVEVEPRHTLVDVIRDDCGQTGTHIGCEHGVCGACTVLLDGEPMRSCLMFAVQANEPAYSHCGGPGCRGINCIRCRRPSCGITRLQCGFCTPGFV